MIDLAFCSNDLMFVSQVSRAAAAQQLAYRSVASLDDLQNLPADGLAAVRLVVFDLANVVVDPAPWTAAVRQLAPQARIIAYGPHVETEQLDAARQVGCDQVLTRGQFHQHLADILSATARSTD